MLKGWRLPFRRRQRSGLILGEAASGKTTLLYTLMGLENVETIPTIGFNVEEIPFKASHKYTLWDVGGGCGKMRPLLKHYITPDKFCIFLHDVTSDDELTQESLDGFRMMLEDYSGAGGGNMFVAFTKQDLMGSCADQAVQSKEPSPKNISLLAKQFEDIAALFRTGPYAVRVKIVSLPGFSTSSRSHADELMTTIHNCLRQVETNAPEVQQDETSPEANERPDILAEAENLIAEAELQTAAEFWDGFNSGTLVSWGHAAHIRAGLGIILQDYLQPHGVFDWAEKFLAHLERLRSQQPHLFRNTAHRTMTVFWLHRIHRALRLYMSTKDTSGLPGGHDALLPELDAFAQIIRCDPSLADRSLWRQFYTQKRMFSPEAKESWCLPDLDQLSDIVTGTAGLESTSLVIPSAPNADSATDLRLPRYAFVVIKASLLSGARRAFMIKHSLVALERVTMQKRSRGSGQAVQPPIPAPYSETQAYFWMQYVHYLLKTVCDAEADGGKATSQQVSKPSIFASGQLLHILSFEALQSLFALTGKEWTKFYTAPVWNSIASRSSFTAPDIQQLPNVFPYPTRQSQQQAFDVLVQRGMTIPYNSKGNDAITDEEMAFFTELVISQVDWVIHDEMPSSSGDGPEITAGETGMDDVRKRVKLIMFVHRGLLDAMTVNDDSSASHTRLSHTSMALSTALTSEQGGDQYTTHAFFWVRMVTEALFRDIAKGRQPVKDWKSAFLAFLRFHPQLSLPQLPQQYYSLELWQSADAKATYIMPDRVAGSGNFNL